jgi:hypothetical protein
MKNVNWRIALKWGAVYALLTLIWLSLESMAGLHDSRVKYRVILTNLKYIPMLLIYYAALREARNLKQGAAYPYGRAFIDGLRLTAMATLLSIPAQYLSMEYLVPDFLQKMEAAMIEGRWMTALEAKRFFDFRSYFIQSILAIPATGLMLTAITALFVHRNAAEEER